MISSIPSGRTIHGIDTDGWMPGVYVVRMTVDGRAASARVVILDN
jgi:hypothetical protein